MTLDNSALHIIHYLVMRVHVNTHTHMQKMRYYA